MNPGGLPIAVFLTVTAALLADTPSFVVQTGLLTDTGTSASGLPLAVVDCNGDGLDDIVRIWNLDQLGIDYQSTTPGASFTHHFHGGIATGHAYSISAADLDDDGIVELLVAGNAVSPKPSGLELLKWNGSSYTSSFILEGGILAQGTIFGHLDDDDDLDIFACHDIADLLKFENTGGGSYTQNNNLIDTAFALADDDRGNYSLLATDYDGDGDIDYYLSKCFANQSDVTSPQRINRLFRNDGTSGYTEVAASLGLHDANQSWCSDFADVDNDGDLDAFVGNHPYDASLPSGPSAASRFYRQNASGTFDDDTSGAGLAGLIGFKAGQAIFRDFDRDGWLDLLVSDFEGGTYGYYENDGDGTFTQRTGVFVDSTDTDIGGITSFAVGDLNQDGFPDVFLSRGFKWFPANSTDLLCFNQPNTNGYLRIRLSGPAANRNGIGSRLELHGPWGIQLREVRGGEGYGIMNSLDTHFGLGSEDNATQLVIRWPTGTVDTLTGIPRNHVFTVHEGTNAPSYSQAEWTASFFPSGGADAAPNADPDHDRLPNLIEQFLGFDPLTPNAHDAIQAHFVEDGGTRYFQIEVDRAPTEDLVADFEFLSAAQTWEADPLLEIVEDTLLRFVARVPQGTHTSRLVRLKVSTGP